MRKCCWLSLIDVLTPTIRRDSLEIILGRSTQGDLLKKGYLIYTEKPSQSVQLL